MDPRDRDEIHQEAFAIAAVQSQVSDTNDTAIVNAALAAHAAQIEAIELRQSRLYKSLGLDAEGQDLDDVVGEWPGFEPRLGQSYAQGAVLELYRSSAVGELLASAGTVVSTPSGKRYLLLAPALFMDGHATYPGPGQRNAYIAATEPGVNGNADVGAVSQVIQGPEGLTGCRNVLPLTGGQERETDAELRKRAIDWLAGGINRMTPAAIRALARAFRSQGVLHATIWEDPSRPYAEIILDDGRGFQGLDRPATPYGGVVGPQGQIDFRCDAPVVDDEVTLTVNGAPVATSWTLIHERGRAFFDEESELLEEGDEWLCAGHRVYTDVIAEFQWVLEGLRSHNGRDIGFRAAGARIRARTATPELVEYYVQRTVKLGFEPDEVDRQIRATIDQFHIDLEQGQSGLVFNLSALLRSIRGIDNCFLRDVDDPTVPLGDMVPSTRKHKLVTRPELITIVGI